MTAALWQAVFGSVGPVEVEIGPGQGDVLLAFAARRPDVNFFAIEHASGMPPVIAARAAALGLTNVRVVAGDARCVLATCVPDASVAAYHVYFPDPWPKTRHRARRLFWGGGFARDLRRTLRPDGRVHVATDLPALLADMRRALLAAGFVECADERPPAERPRSKFERKYAAAGTWAATFAAVVRCDGALAPGGATD
jgi:tRNA (guanine-N7-)-methyltransferase